MPPFRRWHLQRVFRTYGNPVPRTFVETGTFRGETLDEVEALFAHVHTIELSEKWYQHALEHFRGRRHIVCHQGDSAECLSRLVPSITEPAVFFLDAHFAGGDTAHGAEEVPLVRELAVIGQRRTRDIIIVDDVRLIGTSGVTGSRTSTIYPEMTYDWTSVSRAAIRQALRESGRLHWLEWDDRLFIITNNSSTELASARLRSVWQAVRTRLAQYKHRLLTP